MKISILTLLACTLLAFSSCKKEDNPKYKLDVEKLTLKVGDRHQFILSKGDKIYKVEHFDWRSSDISIGNVNGSGQIHAAKEGVVTVNVLLDNVVMTKCDVTVKK